MKLTLAALILAVGLTFTVSAQTDMKKADAKAKTEVTKTTAKKAVSKKAKAKKDACCKKEDGKKCCDSEKSACEDKK